MSPKEFGKALSAEGDAKLKQTKIKMNTQDKLGEEIKIIVNLIYKAILDKKPIISNSGTLVSLISVTLIF